MCWPKGKAERRYAGVTHVDVTGFNKDAAATCQRSAAAAGITISASGYYPNPLITGKAEAQVTSTTSSR